MFSVFAQSKSRLPKYHERDHLVIPLASNIHILLGTTGILTIVSFVKGG